MEKNPQICGSNDLLQRQTCSIHPKCTLAINIVFGVWMTMTLERHHACNETWRLGGQKFMAECRPGVPASTRLHGPTCDAVRFRQAIIFYSNNPVLLTRRLLRDVQANPKAALRTQ